MTFSIDAASSSGACSVTGATVSFTAAGTCVIDADQAGDANYTAAPQAQQTVTVTKRSTVTSVVCSPTSVSVGSPTTCTATVIDTLAIGQRTPGGSVSFTSNGAGTFGSSRCTLSGSGASVSCPVSYTPNAVGSGTHTITASYSGDTSHATSSGTVGEDVTAVVAKLADVKVAINGATKAADNTAFTEKITISNAGPATATNVISALIIPTGLTVTNTGGGTSYHSALHWIDNSIASGGMVTHTVTFKVAANACGSVQIPVAAASTQVKDPNYYNNAAAIAVQLGPTNGNKATQGSTKRNPLAIGKRIISRLQAGTIGSTQHAAPFRRTPGLSTGRHPRPTLLSWSAAGSLGSGS